MRTSVGILGGIVLLLIGFVTLSSAAQNTQGPAYNASNQSADVWNTTTQVLQNAGQASGGLVYVAVFVIIAAALGLLVWVGSGGR